MACIQFILYSLIYIIHTLVLETGAAQWKFDVNKVNIKRHHTRFCMYLPDMEPKCVDTDTDKEGLTDEKKKELLESLFHLEYTKKGPFKLNDGDDEDQDPIPYKQSAEDYPSYKEKGDTPVHPLASKPIDAKDREHLSSYEIIEAERDFYKNLYLKLFHGNKKSKSLPQKYYARGWDESDDPDSD